MCDWDIIEIIVLRHLWYTITTKMSYTKEHSDVQNELFNTCTNIIIKEWRVVVEVGVQADY